MSNSPKNQGVDMTSGTEWKSILLFALPIMAGQFLQQLYNTVDGIVVGNYVSEAALGSVGACSTLAFLFLALSVGFGNGCGVMIAQLFGAKQVEKLKQAVSTSMIVIFTFGVIMTLIGYFGAEALVIHVLNIHEPELVDLSTVYFAVYSLGLVFQFLYNCVASILRAVGDSKATLYFLCVSALLNLVLDVLFVAVFRWSITGAAAATVISQLVCCVVCFVYMFKKYPMFRFRPKEFRFSPEYGKLCVQLGFPLTVQQSIVGLGNIFMQRLVNYFGAVTMAAFTCGGRFESYCMIPALGFNSAMAMFTGQNVGAGRIDRVDRAMKDTMKLAMGITLAIATVLFLGAYPLAGLFGVEDESLRQAVDYLRTVSYFMVIFAMYLTMNGVIQGSGDVGYSSFCSLFTLGVRLALSYTLVFVFDFSYYVIWRCIPVGWIIGLFMAMARLKSGKWKSKAIVGGQQP